MKKEPLSPNNFMVSPYDVDRIPPPTVEELVEIGVTPAGDHKGQQISTRIRPEILYAIDRLIERRVYSIKSRQEFYRLALMNLVATLEHEIEQGHVKLLVHRLEQQRRMLAELMQMKQSIEMVLLTRKTVQMLLSYDNRFDAIQTLRRAKRFLEDLPLEGLREIFSNMLYGSEDGKSKPFGWEQDESSALWDKVMIGELDRDDDDTVREQTAIYK